MQFSARAAFRRISRSIHLSMLERRLVDVARRVLRETSPDDPPQSYVLWVSTDLLHPQAARQEQLAALASRLTTFLTTASTEWGALPPAPVPVHLLSTVEGVLELKARPTIRSLRTQALPRELGTVAAIEALNDGIRDCAVARFTVSVPGQPLGSIEVPHGGVIGRTDEAGVVVVESPRISGRHVRVTIRDGRVHIEDLGSRNGTALETGPIDPGVCVPIDTRQRFRIADAWLTLTEVR